MARLIVGKHNTKLTFKDLARGENQSHAIGELDHRLAANFLLDWLDGRIGLTSLRAVGHRVVNVGARYYTNERQS